MIACSSPWMVYGFSPSARSSGCSAETASAATSSEGITGREDSAETYSAAPSPERRPNTSRSDSELPPSRFEPCMPPDTSPAANRPGTEAAPVSGSTSTPPIT